jgi:hypothetical protein
LAHDLTSYASCQGPHRIEQPAIREGAESQALRALVLNIKMEIPDAQWCHWAVQAPWPSLVAAVPASPAIISPPEMPMAADPAGPATLGYRWLLRGFSVPQKAPYVRVRI